MTVEERIGAPVRSTKMVDICECMHYCKMEDIKSLGNFYVWNNKHQGTSRAFSKIDRIMANPNWKGCYPSADACFMNEGYFDHSPGLLTVYPRDAGGKPFKYFTCGRLLLFSLPLFKRNGMDRCMEVKCMSCY